MVANVDLKKIDTRQAKDEKYFESIRENIQDVEYTLGGIQQQLDDTNQKMAQNIALALANHQKDPNEDP